MRWTAFALVTILTLSTPAVAGNFVVDDTVREWRQMNTTNQMAGLAYVMGFMTATSPFMKCPKPFSVAEMHAHLAYTAVLEKRVWEAGYEFLVDKGCTR